GRVYSIKGDIYYSPNCSLDIEVPPPPSQMSTPFISRDSNGKQKMWNLDIRDYFRPRWWTTHFGWLAFL
ncbi:hypothetical protein CPB83DRAFT_731291, partial [Crepidotus variabilis]